VGLPKRRGTIASAAQTPSTRRRAAAESEQVQAEVRKLGEGWLPVEGRVQGPRNRRAGPVVGWGCSACAARFFGGWDDARGAAQPSPQKPPHGAENPDPTLPAARGSAWTPTPNLHEKSRPFATSKPPDWNQLQSAAGQRRREAEQAPAASESLVRPATLAAPRRPQGPPAQLETNGSGHASTPKPWSRECLPESSRVGGRNAPGQNTQARLLPRVLTRGIPSAHSTAFRSASPRPRVG